MQPHRKFSQGVGLLGIATSKDITGPYRVIGYYQIATGKKASTTQYSYEVDDGWKRKADGFYHDSIKLGQELRDFYAFDFTAIHMLYTPQRKVILSNLPK